MSDYYRKFCQNFSVISEPLTRLLKWREHFSWTVDCQNAYDKIQHLLLSVSVLKAPDFDKQFKVMVDASDVGSGAV